MSETTAPPTKLLHSSTPRLQIARYLGIALFAIAFFLPAVGDSADKPFYGWQCAWFTLTLLGTVQDTAFSELLVIFTAAASPIAAVCIVLAFWKKPARVRLWFAPILVACLLAAQIFLIQASLIPLVGHYLWTIGILLIAAPELTPLATSAFRRFSTSK